MASLRPYWKGYLKLSLVNIAVELFSATTSTGKLRMHQFHEPSGKRIRYQKVAEGLGPVDRDEIVKGFEVDDGEFVLLSPEELDEIKLESKRTIDLVQFVGQHEIDPRYFERPYYVVPGDSEVAAEGFAVIREALRESGKVGLGQIAARGRDHIIAIRPCSNGLLAETLRYADEVRESESVFAAIPDVEIDPDLTELAAELIERRSAPFEAEAFRSSYADALLALVGEKRKTGTVEADGGDGAPAGGQSNVVDLMQALKKSLDSEKKRKGADDGKKKKKAPAKRKAKSKVA